MMFAKHRFFLAIVEDLFMILLLHETPRLNAFIVSLGYPTLAINFWRRGEDLFEVFEH